MSRPNVFTITAVPFVDARLPIVLSPALASSSSATILASFSGGGGGGAAAAAAFAALSAAATESAAVSFFAHAQLAHNANTATLRITRIDIRPPYLVDRSPTLLAAKAEARIAPVLLDDQRAADTVFTKTIASKFFGNSNGV